MVSALLVAAGLTLAACGDQGPPADASREGEGAPGAASDGAPAAATTAPDGAATDPDASAACAPWFATCDPTAPCGERLGSDHHCARCGDRCTDGTGCRAGQCTPGVVGLAAGGSHTCALRGDGQLLCWGLGGVGQLGPPWTAARSVPAPVALPQPAMEVTAGRYHTCVVLQDHTAACFGDGGLLGRPAHRPSLQPHAVLTPTLDAPAQLVGLAAGSNHTCGLLAQGRVQCWGGNAGGQLGTGDTRFSTQPRVESGILGAAQIAAGNAHTCVRFGDGSVHCWGLGRYGQLGDGLSTDRTAPAPVVGLSRVSTVAAGEFHTCATNRAGELYCWGRNHLGQLGLGRPAGDDQPLPAPVPIDNVTAVAAGESHTCAIHGSGDLSCWGDNFAGQLGLGDRSLRVRPTAVALPAPVEQIAAGAAHTCALLASGAVYCFGQNDGQLGDGTTTGRTTPVLAVPADALR